MQNPLVSVCLNGKYPTFTVFAFVLLARLPSFLFFSICEQEAVHYREKNM